MAGVTPSDLANMIRALPKFQTGMTVNLLSCCVAQGDFAQELANELGVTVVASDTLVWFEKSDKVRVYAADEGYTFGGQKSGKRNTMDPKNHWISFKPE